MRALALEELNKRLLTEAENRVAGK